MNSTYIVYGLKVQSDTVFSDFLPASEDCAPDLRVTFLHSAEANFTGCTRENYYSDPLLGASGVPPLVVWKVRVGESRFFHFVYDEGVEFSITEDGSEVWARWNPHTSSLEDSIAYFVGPILGFILRLKGFVCLHSAAIAVDGRAVLVMGPHGYGKSSIAAVFAKAGVPVLADDIVTLTSGGGAILARGAYPRLRLWNDSAQAIFGIDLPKITPNWDKRFLNLGNGDYRFQNDCLPVRKIYILGERSDVIAQSSIDPLQGQNALVALVCNTYANYLLDASMRKCEFEFLARTVVQIPVCKITPVSGLERLEELRDRILQDCCLA